ncbi:hypothetical protein PBRA_005704 [Plasmodiophora brassicae]|uniref:C2H2-type domain-containing protein n=1 Tax=Plasmodiophora brassicae TaxID=37360 RepID=A0A0G4IPH6_PLABS|nr:hypothetical protein PBRA_005704 [Plasmodiophora brassicae]
MATSLRRGPAIGCSAGSAFRTPRPAPKLNDDSPRGTTGPRMPAGSLSSAPSAYGSTLMYPKSHASCLTMSWSASHASCSVPVFVPGETMALADDPLPSIATPVYQDQAHFDDGSLVRMNPLTGPGYSGAMSRDGLSFPAATIVPGRPVPVIACSYYPPAYPFRKRRRALASQVDRKYACTYQGCEKAYGSAPALNLHMKLKHPDAIGDVKVQPDS